MEAEARASQKLDWTDIRIPVGPRLGNKVLEAHHLHKEFDGRVLIDDLSFTLPRNGIVGVIGPNGVGKTTLFKTIVGLEPLTSGELEVGETVKISYVDQNRSGIDPDKNLWEVVSDGLDYMMVGETEVPSRAYVASFGLSLIHIYVAAGGCRCKSGICPRGTRALPGTVRSFFWLQPYDRSRRMGGACRDD